MRLAAAGTRRRSGQRYRRSPGLVVYWRSSGPVAVDCRSGTRSPITHDVLNFLASLAAGQTVNQLVTAHPELGSKRDVQTLLEVLVDRGLVERQSGAADEWLWRVWTPEAAFFHFGTRNPTFSDSRRNYEMQLREKARHYPPPPATKSMRGFRVDLPAAGVDGSLARALHSRRTWRRFAAGPLGLETIGSLLDVTFGVQKREHVDGQGPMVRKTSPSGGARHSIEAYLLALNVSGIGPGAYHYDADTHELVDLQHPIRVEALSHALADQRWFLRAGALVVMSAVFERAMWRYPFSRAYRSILTEAGHLGQTFCLVATALDLAPFCTMAFRDRDLEAMIGADGVSEAAMYVVGVGARPRGHVANPGKIPAGA